MLRCFGFWSCLSVYLMLSVSVFAAQDSLSLSLERKILLQARLAQYISSLSAEDGGFSNLDRQDATIKTAYPASLHPKIITIGDSYFLCITMRDETGKSIDADFLLRAKSGIDPRLAPKILLLQTPLLAIGHC